MRREWDERARRNARHYITDGQIEWTDADFWGSGEITVAQDILTDMVNIRGDKNPRDMRVVSFSAYRLRR